MHPQLAQVRDDFAAATDRLHRIVTATPAHRWSERSDPARWSVAECVAHLNATSRAYVPLVREALATRPPVDPPPHRYRRGVVGWMIGKAVGPLPRLGRTRIGRVRTSPAFAPAGALDRDVVLPEFDALQQEQIALVEMADGRPLEAIRIVSPFDARLGYNAFACLALLPRHQHRHLGQAEEVWGGR